MKESNFYGLSKETLDSLMLSLLPTGSHKYQRLPPYDEQLQEHEQDMELFLMKTLLDTVKSNVGLHLPIVSVAASVHCNCMYIFTCTEFLFYD